MPIQRGQPAPERQSVLSFVSPSVADLLFYETVDAKTVGAGSGVTISSATWAAESVDVPAGIHKAGFTVTVTTSAAHGFSVGDVVTVEGLGDREDDSAYSRPNGTHEITDVPASAGFRFFVEAQPDAASPLDVTNNPHCYKAHPSYGTAHPDTENFPHHKLCYVKQADAEGLFFEYYYVAERHHQDDYNFEFSQADLGGTEYDTVIRTYILLRSDFIDTDTAYQAGDAMPDVPASQFTDSYILMTRQQKRIGEAELDSLFVVEQRVYFKDEDKVSFSTDPEFNDELRTTEILAHVGKSVPTKAGTVTWAANTASLRVNWGVKTETAEAPETEDGVYNYEVVRLSNDWWKITKQQIVGANLLAGISYKTNRNYSYPAELIGFRFTLIARRDGSEENSVVALEKDAFSGPIIMTVRRQWYASAATANAALESFGDITTFKPRSGSYSGALYSLSYSNVLCTPFTLIDTVGTGHPTYKLGAYAHNFFEQGSTPPAQPASGSTVNVAATSQQFRGGYLVETVTGVIP